MLDIEGKKSRLVRSTDKNCLVRVRGLHFKEVLGHFPVAATGLELVDYPAHHPAEHVHVAQLALQQRRHFVRAVGHGLHGHVHFCEGGELPEVAQGQVHEQRLGPAPEPGGLVVGHQVVV